MFKNLTRSRFIAAVLVFVVYLVKFKCPDFPDEAAYGFIAYIIGESAADAIKLVRNNGKGDKRSKGDAPAQPGSPN